LESLHEIGYVYNNNFSLTNIVLNNKHDRVSLFSFERCMPYIDKITKHHLPRTQVPFFSGDAKFSSIG